MTNRDHANLMIGDRRRFRATAANPCPVCGHGDWCLVSPGACLCPRADGAGAVRRFGEYGWLYVFGAEPTPSYSRPAKELTDGELHARWAPVAERLRQGSDTQIGVLAIRLGVSAASLRAIGVGFGECCGRVCWSFPQRNDEGQVVGISRRLVAPTDDGLGKMTAPGSRAGLSYADNWADGAGPVLIVEGGSDVAACITIGLDAIGRPSNTGGVRYLVRMLARTDRPVVVIGERDHRAHHSLTPEAQARHKAGCRWCAACWPGKYGAVRTARALTEKLGRRVRWSMPPGAAKDTRSWLNEAAGKTAKPLGELFLKEIERCRSR